jgi:excisionase family DNA binding protein
MLEFSQLQPSRFPIPEKLLFDRSEFSALTGLSLRTVANLIADGTLRVKRVGRRTLILRSELLRFCEVPESPTSR